MALLGKEEAKISMRLIITSVAILVLLGLVHFGYGPGCWGLQPGGRWTSLLFLVQGLLSIGSLIYSVFLLKRNRSMGMYGLTFLAVALAGIANWQFWTLGYRMLTSIHNQGSENLPTFFATSLVAIAVGVQAVVAKARENRG